MDEMRFKIVEVLSKTRLAAADTPFHAAGGGQPGDTGTLLGEDSDGKMFRAEVLDARKGEGGGTVLDIRVREGTPKAGMEVTAKVDRERNALLSRMHTGQHIFSRFQENACEGLETLKVNIGVGESVVYVRYDGNLTWEELFALEEQTVGVIAQDLPVESFIASREEAEKLPELKARWERIHDRDIRIVRIAGIDATACSGTHTSRTGEIGGFMVTGFNGSAPDWEVHFTVQTEELTRNYTRAARRLVREVGCPVERLEDVFMRQRAENADLSRILDRVRGLLSVPWEERGAGGRPLFFASLPGLTKDLISPHARERVAETPDAFALVLLPGSMNPEEPFPFILLRGQNPGPDLTVFPARFPQLGIRGGGKPQWLNGTTTERSPAVWVQCLERFLE